MWRFLKWFGFFIAAIVFALAIALGLAYFYKKEILAAVNKELTKSINGEISIGDIDFGIREFPNVSIALRNIYLRGPQYARYHTDFLNAEKVFIDLYLGPLLHKEISIRSIRVITGNFFIFRTKTGYTNLDVFKSGRPKDSVITSSPVAFSFDHVRLKDVKFLYYDSLKKKSIDLFFLDATNQISKTDSSNLFALAGRMNFGGLMLNSEKGSYLENKEAEVTFHLEYNSARQKLMIHPSSMKFKRSDLDLSGYFSFAAPGNFVLNVGSKKLNYYEGLSLLTKSIQSRLEKYKVEKPVNIRTTIAGSLVPGSKPDVDIKFSFVNSKVAVAKITAQRVTLRGSFTNHLDSTLTNDDHNSMLALDNFNGIIKGLPTQMTVTVRDFDDPFIELKSSINLDLRYFNKEFDVSQIKFSRGIFTSQLEYVGRLNEYLDQRRTKYEGKLKGAASIKQASFQLGQRKLNVEKFNMSVRFDQNQLTIDNVSLLLNKNPLVVKGEILGFVPFFFQPAKKGNIRLDLYSKRFDFTSLLAGKSKGKPTDKQLAAKRKTFSDMVDELYKKIEFNLSLQIDEVLYRKLKGSALKGTIILARQKLEAKSISVKLADGDFNFSMAIEKLDDTVNPLSVTGTIADADIKKLLYECENFKQKAVTDNNLSGKVNIKLRLNTNIDDDFQIATQRMRGNIELSIKNGKLTDFEPLQHMSNFLMKKRDFENVEFGEIKTRFTLRGTEIYFRKMEIESSVLRLFMEGQYSLANNTNLSVQIPLSNLKKRDKNYKPQNVGVDARQGVSVFLHVYSDTNGKTIITYDPFKKHVKSKK